MKKWVKDVQASEQGRFTECPMPQLDGEGENISYKTMFE